MNLASINPSPKNVAFRRELAELLLPLRRARPKVPFFRLPAHRVPTLNLYRNLLRNAPADNIRWRISVVFRNAQHLTSPPATIEKLKLGYKLLDSFQLAKDGDLKQRKILERYEKIIFAIRKKYELEKNYFEDVEFEQQLRRRPPIFTGSALWASLNNPVIPRMIPQPPEVSGMIRRRIQTYERRRLRKERLLEMRKLITEEISFEKGSRETLEGWQQPIDDTINEIEALNMKYYDRGRSRASPKLERMLKAARKRRIKNKTREKARERRGEILPATIRRARKGPPAPVLAMMTPKVRMDDKTMRQNISETGYLGKLKQSYGWKVHEGLARGKKGHREQRKHKDRGDVWDVEQAEWVNEKKTTKLENMLLALRKENAERRQSVHATSSRRPVPTAAAKRQR